jgi:hypothetical protein
MQDLTFLTREDRMNTSDMLVNPDDALIALKWPTTVCAPAIPRPPCSGKNVTSSK